MKTLVAWIRRLAARGEARDSASPTPDIPHPTSSPQAAPDDPEELPEDPLVTLEAAPPSPPAAPDERASASPTPHIPHPTPARSAKPFGFCVTIHQACGCSTIGGPQDFVAATQTVAHIRRADPAARVELIVMPRGKVSPTAIVYGAELRN